MSKLIVVALCSGFLMAISPFQSAYAGRRFGNVPVTTLPDRSHCTTSVADLSSRLQHALETCRALTTPIPIGTGLKQVVISQHYQFASGLAPSDIVVEGKLNQREFPAETRFRNSLLKGNHPHQETVAWGQALVETPEVYVSVVKSHNGRSGIFAVATPTWANPPAGWVMVKTTVKHLRIDTVKHRATPIRGFWAHWGAFWAGNDPQFDHSYLVNTSSAPFSVELWVKYDD